LIIKHNANVSHENYKFFIRHVLKIFDTYVLPLVLKTNS